MGNKYTSIKDKFPFINKLRQNPKVSLLISAAAMIAIIVVAFLWVKEEPYGVLFDNLSDKDGGEIVAQLDRMNIPYQFSSSGAAILIAKNNIYDTRLRLAQQGLPKGGAVGFELLDKERFGMSQFTEQINYQRALEGELSRTIATISSVEAARVHLALPKPSVFVRERKQPTASVTLTLLPGRALTQGQIDAITHLISSSVAELPADKVTLVDQNGNLLTSEKNSTLNLNGSQLEFAERIENRVRSRIEKILDPLLGQGNVTVQVNADIDFSRQESTTEIFDPNSEVAKQSIRSQQTIENDQTGSVTSIGGVPGALSNQPTPVASAPIDSNEQTATKTTSTTDSSDKKAITSDDAKNIPVNHMLNSTINYEVNRQITHSQIPEGRIKRLSVAVLVNSKVMATLLLPDPKPADTTTSANTPVADSNSDSKTAALITPHLSDHDVLNQIEALVRQAMGFSEQRGDSLTVANLVFSAPIASDDQLAFWQTPQFYDGIITFIKYLILAIVAFIVWRKVAKPWWKKLQAQLNTHPESTAGEPMVDSVSADTNAATDLQRQKLFEDSEQQQQYIREIAEKDPRLMAMIMRSWMNEEGNK